MRLKALTLAMFATLTHATDFTPTTFLDEVDANVGDGICQTITNNCSLRAAIQEANANPTTAHNILLATGTYLIELEQTGENQNLTGDLDVYSEVSILGKGITETFIDANYKDRHFHILPSEHRSILSISKLTLKNGLSNDESGGSVNNFSTFHADEVLFENNTNNLSSLVGKGGAIYSNENNDVSVSNSFFTHNKAHEGGAVFLKGNSLLSGNEFTNNSAEHGGAVYAMGNTVLKSEKLNNNIAGYGGSIYADGSLNLDEISADNNNSLYGGVLYVNEGAEARVTNSVLSGNSSIDGGAIYNKGKIELYTSRIESNQASSNGGGVFNIGDFKLEMSTGITNTANTAGGFIYNASSVYIINSTLLNNSAAVNGGLSFNATGTSTYELVSIANNDTDIDNTFYTVSGLTDLKGNYIQGSPISNLCVSAALPEKTNSRNYNLLSHDSCGANADDIISAEVFSIENTGIQTYIKPHATSFAVDLFFGGTLENLCAISSHNGIIRSVAYCDSGSYQQNGRVENSGDISLPLIDREVNELTPNPSNADVQTIQIPITRSNGSDGELTVNYQSINVNSTSNNISDDYTSTSGELIWSHGDSSTKKIEVIITEDENIEPNEKFKIIISTPSNGVITTQEHTITILDNDSRKGTFSFSSPILSINEGESITAKIIREDFNTGDVDIELELHTLNNLEQTQIALSSSTISFTEGQSEAEVTISVKDNGIYNEGQTAILEILNLDNQIELGSGYLSPIAISESSLKPTYGEFKIAYPISIQEGSSESITFTRETTVGDIQGTVVLKLTPASDRVSIETEILTFSEGENEVTTIMTISENNTYEGITEHSLYIEIEDFYNANPLAYEPSIFSEITFNINDNEVPPSSGMFNLDSTSITFNNEGESQDVTITRTNGSDGEFTININVIEGTATNADIALSTQSITFAEGQTSASFNVMSVVDSVFEEDEESLSINISSTDDTLQFNNTSMNVSFNDGQADEKVLESRGGSLGFSSLLLTLLILYRKRKSKVISN